MREIKFRRKSILSNYFQTKEEAQEVADKLKKYFQELINTKK